MRTIHKYGIESVEFIALEMPVCAEILCVAQKDGVPYLWAQIETDPNKDGTAPTETRFFRMAGTGQDLDIPMPPYIGHIGTPYNLRYVGTIFYNVLVYHLYEILLP
jgi:hypothetical protein